MASCTVIAAPSLQARSAAAGSSAARAGCKTRLAIEAARGWGGREACFVELSPLLDATLIPSAIAAALDYAFGGADPIGHVIISNCVEPLLTVDTDGQPAPLLATNWENPDDQTYIFHLRPGVMFQDGSPLSADAVDYSMGRIRANKASAPYPQLVYADKIEKPDQATIRLTLNQPFAPFLYDLADNAGRVISPAIGEKYGNDRLKSDPTNAGTGPFKFVEWRSDDHVTLARNEAYWGRDALGVQLPYADRLIYRVIPDNNQALASLRSGEIDAFQLAIGTGGAPPQEIARLKADPSLRYADRPGVVQTLFFSSAREPFGSREVRQAMSFAIDREAISHAVYFDTALPLDVLFSPVIGPATRPTIPI